MVLSELACVSKVIFFEEDTPENIIRLIRPDILFKGADYAGKTIVGSEISGETRLIDFRYSSSTTSIVKKLIHEG